MYKYQQEYTLGWVDDCLQAVMEEKQEAASKADPMQAAVLWADVHHAARLRKALVQAGRLARDWKQARTKE